MQVQRVIADEAAEYESGLSRAHLKVVRTGLGHGPNLLRSVALEGAHTVSGIAGFPVIGETTLGDDTIAVILSIKAPEGSRWCEIDLEPGTMLLYGPGAQHYAVSPPGVEYRFALIDRWRVEAMADSLRISIPHPAPGSVTRLNPTAAVRALGSMLSDLGSPGSGPAVRFESSAELLLAMTRVLADSRALLRAGHGTKIDSRHVVRTCVEHAEATKRIPRFRSSVLLHTCRSDDCARPSTTCSTCRRTPTSGDAS